jgi:hypothetical protein
VDATAIWILILSVSTPIAGVIGFAIQLRHIKKARLENEKLQLEIFALRARAEETEKRIVIPTNQEVQKITYGEVMFSRGGSKKMRDSAATFRKESLKKYFGLSLFFTVTFLFVGYLIYDLYRFGVWLYSML